LLGFCPEKKIGEILGGLTRCSAAAVPVSARCGVRVTAGKDINATGSGIIGYNVSLKVEVLADGPPSGKLLHSKFITWREIPARKCVQKHAFPRWGVHPMAEWHLMHEIDAK
jgi:hypothetical protein